MRFRISLLALWILLSAIEPALTRGEAPAAATKSDAATQPDNVVLIYIDNVGYGDLGCYGNRDVKTPNIDRLASEGVRCTDFYVSTSSCTPSRAALLTGRYPDRNGLNWQLSPAQQLEGTWLRHGERLIPQYLKPAGYATAAYGKWNIGFSPGSRPTDRGFDEYFGHASGNIDYYTHVYNGRNDLFRGGEAVTVEGYSTDLFADAACDFIQRHAAQPFFVYVPFNAPHFNVARNTAPGKPVEWQVPAKYLELYGLKADEPDEKRRYRAVLTSLDDGIGRILQTLDKQGLRDKTLVWVISDNGAFMLPGRGLEVATNAPLRDGGITCYEGGLRVPAIARWPGRLPAGVECHEPLIHLDVLPMCLRAAGVAPPKEIVLDGCDPTDTLAGKAPSPHERLYFHYANTSGLREGRYKIVRPKKDAPWELYDLSADIGETKNLAPKQPELAERLAKEYDQWQAAVKQ